MIRNANAADLPALRTLALGTEMFLGDELDAFLSEASMALASSETERRLKVAEADARGRGLDGAVYYGPETMAQGVANLLFIATAPERRRQGVASELLAAFELESRLAGARLAVIETASDPMFAPAQAFYARHGYAEAARIKDYYDDGLDKLIFRKRL